MTGAVLRLRAHEVWSALEVIDPVAVLVEDLIGRTVGGPGHTGTAVGRLVPWHGPGSDDGELVLLEHPGTALPCVLPVHSLRISLAAALTALAARELLTSSSATVAVVGSAEAARPQLSMLS